MIVISRALAQQFRAVLRRTLQDGDQRNAWPVLLCRAGPQGLCLEALCGDIAVRYQHPQAQAPDTLAFRSTVLAQIEGRIDAPVELERLEETKGRARFDDGGVPQSVDFDLVAADSVPALPAMPKKLASLPAEFLTALNEAGRTCAPASTRFALTRIQLRGQKGEVVATDGKQLLVQRGFTFPWPEDVLIPRLSVFGGREVAAENAVSVGRTDKHVELRVGPWTFVLAIDADSRFPIVETVVPRTTSTTSRLHIDEADAGYLINILPRLPGTNDPNTPVTIHLGQDQAAVVRACGDDKDAATEAPLLRSNMSGPAVSLSLNRVLLRRALQLGFRELQLPGVDKPILCRDERRLYVCMALSKDSVVPSSRNVLRLSSDVPIKSPLSLQTERKNEPMPASPSNDSPAHGNGNGNGNGNGPDQSQPPRPGLNEMIDEAEQLRALLQDASTRLARLLGALKTQKRQSRAVQQAMASLRQLQLEP